MSILRGVTASLLLFSVAGCAVGTYSQSAAPAIARGGVTEWVRTGVGRLKTKVYASASQSAHPILVMFLHGDNPDPRPSYQYEFSRALA